MAWKCYKREWRTKSYKFRHISFSIVAAILAGILDYNFVRLLQLRVIKSLTDISKSTPYLCLCSWPTHCDIDLTMLWPPYWIAAFLHYSQCCRANPWHRIYQNRHVICHCKCLMSWYRPIDVSVFWRPYWLPYSITISYTIVTTGIKFLTWVWFRNMSHLLTCKHMERQIVPTYSWSAFSIQKPLGYNYLPRSVLRRLMRICECFQGGTETIPYYSILWIQLIWKRI